MAFLCLQDHLYNRLHRGLTFQAPKCLINDIERTLVCSLIFRCFFHFCRELKRGCIKGCGLFFQGLGSRAYERTRRIPTEKEERQSRKQ
jgi:hypothetical protein